MIGESDLGDASFATVEIVEDSTNKLLGAASFAATELASPSRRSLAPLLKDGALVGELGFAAVR